MSVRLILALLLLLQSVPVAVLAESHCRACDDGMDVKAGMHCPLRRGNAAARHCHERREVVGARIVSVHCTCGERSAEALRKGDPKIPVVRKEEAVRIIVSPAFVAAIELSRAEREMPPPDPPPRLAALL